MTVCSGCWGIDDVKFRRLGNMFAAESGRNGGDEARGGALRRAAGELAEGLGVVVGLPRPTMVAFRMGGEDADPTRVAACTPVGV
jgi:hypothetical protein